MYPPAYEFLPTSQLIRPVIADWYTAGVFLRPPGKSTNRVSDMIPFSTLRGRLKGAQPHFIAHSQQQLLTPTDEKPLVRWIQILENSGFPPRIEHVKQAAKLILRGSIGEHWITRFLNRHPKLAVKLTSPLERGRIEAEDPHIIRDHFIKEQRIITAKRIQQKNTYNMDEKRFLLGLGECSKVICSYKG